MSGSKARTWTLQTVLDQCEEEGLCWLWQGSVNVRYGYPQASINGKSGTLVRRHLFLNVLRRSIPKGHVLTTKCGSRICCSPRCLVTRPYGEVLKLAYATGARWVTAQEQRARTLSRCGHVKLTMEKARAIRTSNEPTAVLCERFGVNRRTVNRIKRGELWKEPKPSANASVFNWASSHLEAA